jgi:hypothetical protein
MYKGYDGIAMPRALPDTLYRLNLLWGHRYGRLSCEKMRSTTCRKGLAL